MNRRVVALLLCACASVRTVRAAVQCPDGSPPPCAPARPAGPPTLVVQRFENRGADTADAYLTVALAEELTNALAATRTVRLLSARPGQRGVDYAVSAAIRRTGDVIRITARLERPATGEIVWTSAADYQRGRAAALVDQLARGIVARVAPGAQRAMPAARRPVDHVAYDLYQRGRYHLSRQTEGDIGRAAALFRQAVARDSSFAAAWAGLSGALDHAQTWGLQVQGVPPESLMARQLEAAERALLLDSTDAEMWIARGLVAARVDPSSRRATVRALQRAIALDSLNLRGWYLLAMALLESGHGDSARRTMERAVSVDPTFSLALNTMALSLYWARRYDSARVWIDSQIAVDPTLMAGRRLSGTIALAQRRYADAETQFVAARAVGPGPERIWAIAGLAVAATARGDTTEARALAAEAQDMTDARRPPRHSAVFLAWIWTSLGDHERALSWLERYRPAADRHFQVHLAGDAPLDALRSEPRFRALLR